MTAYVVGMQDFWEGRWLDLGSPVRVDADSPAAALDRIDRASVGLNPGVLFRFRITGPDGDVFTDPVHRPDFPTTIAGSVSI